MRSPVAGIAALFVLFVVLIVAYSSVFTVAQTEQVLVVRLGEPVRVVSEPGLNFKAPFIDSVISIDKRILDLENPSQEVIASDQKRLVVDAFARYRIKNALRFYQSVGSIQAAPKPYGTNRSYPQGARRPGVCPGGSCAGRNTRRRAARVSLRALPKVSALPKVKRTSSGRFQSDEVHSVRRLPHR